MDFVSARVNMVESQVRTNDVTDVQLQEAMRVIRRERFAMPSRAPLAYSDRPCEYAPGQFLLPPREVGKLLQAARPHAGERVLAIAAPYAAAMMARLGVEVHALDTPEAHARVSAELAEEGVKARSGDLAAPEGSYDLIVSEAAVPQVPQGWFAALSSAGRMAVILRSGAVGKATLFLRAGEAFSAREVFDAFPPVLPGFDAKPAFVF